MTILDEGATNVTASNVTVTLAENSSQDYSVDVTRNEATVAVSDNDVPQLSICQTADGTSCVADSRLSGVEEGDTSGNLVRFLIMATSAVDGNVTVNLDPQITLFNVSAPILASTPGSSVVIPGGSETFVFSYTTAPDNEPGGGGEITVELLAGTGYTVASAPDNSATAFVNEDDLPELRITGPTTVQEDEGTIAFTVTLTGELDESDSSGLQVAVDFAGGGTFFSSAPARETVTITRFNTTRIINITVPANDVDNIDADLTATIVDAFVNPDPTDREYAIPQASHTVRIEDNDTPVLAITAVSSPVTEGAADAVFTVNANIAPKSNLNVALTVAESAVTDATFVGDELADFVDGANEGNQVFTFPGGETTATYTVAIVNDTLDEPTGDVTVTLAANDPNGGQEYTVGTPNDATVRVSDDDRAQLSICQTTDGTTCVAAPVDVQEGDTSGNNLVFLVTATSQPGTDITVDLAIDIDSPDNDWHSDNSRRGHYYCGHHGNPDNCGEQHE